MLITSYRKNIIWYHFQDVINEGNFNDLKKKYNIDNYITKRFCGEIHKDKALKISKHLFFSISLPDFQQKAFEKQTFKFIIGEDYIISFCDSYNIGLDKFREDFENKTHLNEREKKEKNPVVFAFLHMFEKIYGNMILELENISTKIDKIGQDIEKEKEKEMVFRISEINRKLIDFRRYLKTHDNSWELFFQLSRKFFPNENSHSVLEGVILPYQKVLALADQLQEIIWELRDTNNSLLNAKLGETTRTFTLIAFLTLPITMFVSIISIPTKQNNFFLGHQNDFNLIVFSSLILFIIMLIISKFKKWW